VRGDQPPQVREIVQLDEIVLRAVSAATVHGRSRDIQIDTVTRPSAVFGHPDGIERAINNLLSNAIKWGPVGSRVVVFTSGGSIWVRDQGPGIAPEDIPHIFNRFYRSSSAGACPDRGSGWQ